MSARRVSISRLLSISFVMLAFAAVLLSQTQSPTQAKAKEETKAQTQAETKAGTQAQPKAGTQGETKGGTQVQTKAGTQAAIREGTKADTLQLARQAQKAIPKKTERVQTQTTRVKSFSVRCQALNTDGTRCTRKALPGSKYCRLHTRK